MKRPEVRKPCGTAAGLHWGTGLTNELGNPEVKRLKSERGVVRLVCRY